MTSNVMIGNRSVDSGSPTYVIARSAHIAVRHSLLGFLSTYRQSLASSCFVEVVWKFGAVWPKGKVDYCVGPEIATDGPRLDSVAC